MSPFVEADFTLNSDGQFVRKSVPQEIPYAIYKSGPLAIRLDNPTCLIVEAGPQTGREKYDIYVPQIIAGQLKLVQTDTPVVNRLVNTRGLIAYTPKGQNEGKMIYWLNRFQLFLAKHWPAA